ncbi:DUF1772 domain-containing protein [Mycobacterium shimoidei]|uniref:DUF1772 domain-containing protein n=1 Tax=Mycobacterium shimoidei TaxID=29313 RepID=UPI000848F98D|nr:DUF1772 domain-containing protein [Mycobacterium shimoidei]MCV7260661.1 DUF1772 domain-containing protein [Mycobacterium shimoidei]ODR13802.1 hypothetical protein BHQ16_08990 [Mycobacterium shimoidei]ORW76362.1 hypothetical protein AWC26_21815 [Mycobacterium shimoidei]
MKELIEIPAVLVTGSLVGVEFGVAAFSHPLLARLPDDAFRAARSESSRVLGKAMPFWYIASLALLVAAAVIARSPLVGAAVVLMAAAILLTVTVLVPINNRVAAWSAGGEVSYELADRWDQLHWLRVASLAALFVLLTVGCFG